MNLKRKIRFALLMMLLLMLIFTVKASAVSISISTSASSVSAGGTFTAMITGSDATGRVNISVTNGTASESSVWVENDSQSVTVTAGSSGTVSISASGELSNSEGTEDKTVSASASVSIATATTSDSSSSTSNSSSTSDSGSTTTTTTVSSPVLSNLGITPYDFSGFKSGTTSYSVTVPNDCTSVTIYATTNSTGATISGTGAVTLKEGTNKYTVTVSNSAGSKSYTISIVRQSEENEIVANTSEDETTEETEETSTGIGLNSLTITGYELNEEFDINTYEYTVTLSEEITDILLEEIKEKIFWTANSEDVNVEYEIEALEDGTSGTITLIVKDDEKEYSRYTITFLNSEELEEEETTKIGVAGTTSDNNSGTTGGSGLSDSGKKIIEFIACICVLAGFGIYFAIHTYIKDHKVANADEFKEKEIDEEENENLVESILKAREVEFPKLESDMPENVETISTEKMDALMDDIESLEPESENDLNLEKAKAEDLAKDTKEKLAELNGYRKFRKGFSSGKH